MKEGPDIASVAALIAEPARANILAALTDGRAFTAGELAREAGVTPQTASGHLARLRDAGLILVTMQGRHRYHRLAGPEVAATLESLMVLASRTGRLRSRPGPRDADMRQARTCYDHLAGARGVAMLDALMAGGLVVSGAQGLSVTPSGEHVFRAEGIDPSAPPNSRRPLCRACLDWSERRPHLAGTLGARLLSHLLDQRWLLRSRDSRVVRFTPPGEREFAAFLDRLAGKSPRRYALRQS